MRIIRRTNQFKKDYKLAIKRGKEIKKLDNLIIKLAKGEKLEEKLRDHICYSVNIKTEESVISRVIGY